jgi:1-acyl-sn-glycerol-3-phosphate acyltransferase
MPRPGPPNPSPTLTRVSKAVLMAYMKAFHNFRIVGMEHVPPAPPALCITNHVSLLDVPAFALTDPYSGSVLVAKEELLRIPIVKQVLEGWGVIPVSRDGQDLGALREIRRKLDEGRLVAIASEGTRNRQGILGHTNPVLARLAMGIDAPILPVVVTGTYRCLPPGAKLPKPGPIRIVIGPTYSLAHLRSGPKKAATEEARRIIRERLLALLPPRDRERSLALAP